MCSKILIMPGVFEEFLELTEIIRQDYSLSTTNIFVYMPVFYNPKHKNILDNVVTYIKDKYLFHMKGVLPSAFRYKNGVIGFVLSFGEMIKSVFFLSRHIFFPRNRCVVIIGEGLINSLYVANFIRLCNKFGVCNVELVGYYRAAIFRGAIDYYSEAYITRIIIAFLYRLKGRNCVEKFLFPYGLCLYRWKYTKKYFIPRQCKVKLKFMHVRDMDFGINKYILSPYPIESKYLIITTKAWFAHGARKIGMKFCAKINRLLKLVQVHFNNLDIVLRLHPRESKKDLDFYLKGVNNTMVRIDSSPAFVFWKFVNPNAFMIDTNTSLGWEWEALGRKIVFWDWGKGEMKYNLGYKKVTFAHQEDELISSIKEWLSEN